MRAVRNRDPIAVHRVRVVKPDMRGCAINVIVELVDGDDDHVIAVAPEAQITSAFARVVSDVVPRSPVTVESQSRGFSVVRGARVGKYVLEDKLGQGTFGMVHTARDTELDREVALKILNPSHHGDSEILQRFLREGRAAARIEHPGIITVLDCGRHTGDDGDEIAFIAMERLRGESLTQRLARAGRLLPETAAEIARQVASALEAAHRASVLHRDLKPDNIYLVPDPAMPAGERVKILDFGLAKLGTSGTTQIRTVFGTPRYMSPEQTRSSALIDHRSDIYALGCILFELVTGRTPFEGELYKIVEGHQQQLAPRARSLAPDVDPALDELIALMLSKDPVQRPPTMAAVERALQRAGALVPGVAATILPQDARELAAPPQVHWLPDVRPPGEPTAPPPDFDDQITSAQEYVELEIAGEPSIIVDDQLPAIPQRRPTERTTHTKAPRRKWPAMMAVAAITIGLALGLALSLLADRKTAAAAPPPPASRST